MPHTTGQGLTVATCCYCGAKGALCLKKLAKKSGQRELTCQSCGAPLRALKAVKTAPPAPRPVRPKKGSAPPRGRPQPPRIPTRKGRRRPSLMARITSGLADLVEDALDEIEDVFD